MTKGYKDMRYQLVSVQHVSDYMINDDGDVTCDWIQCTNEQCSPWMHTTRLDKSDGEYNCAVCQNVFC